MKNTTLSAFRGKQIYKVKELLNNFNFRANIPYTNTIKVFYASTLPFSHNLLHMINFTIV